MSYSLDGNRVSQTDSINGTTEYTYDKAGQLKTERLTKNGAASVISYAYDTRGNRINKNTDGTICNYTYDLNNRLISDNDGIRTNSYTYDKNGNMTSRLSGELIDGERAVAESESLDLFGISETAAATTENSTAVTYGYDLFNRLKTVNTDDGLTASYKYHADGRRAEKTVNGVTSWQWWDGDNIIAEADADGAVTSRYYRGLDLAASKTDNIVSYYSYDPHGSVVKLGTDSYTYDAFGNQKNDDDTAYNPFRYCGEYYDAETGFIYLRNRYYSPDTGRFITEDPAKDGLNWYAYCENNPVNRWDPNGKSWDEYDAFLPKWVQDEIKRLTNNTMQPRKA